MTTTARIVLTRHASGAFETRCHRWTAYPQRNAAGARAGWLLRDNTGRHDDSSHAALPAVREHIARSEDTERPAASEVQRREQAAHIARLAEAIATGAVVGPEHAAVRRLADAVELLREWTPDDRG